MVSPFPGMDPWLEHPARWHGLHNLIISGIALEVGPALRPRYYVSIEERTYLAPDGGELVFVGRPDVTVASRAGSEPPKSGADPAAASAAVLVEVPVPDTLHETWLEVRAAENHEVVTVLELLAPANKREGEGRRLYEEKRARVLGTRTHLIEVDLLRAGEPMRVYGAPRAADYRLLVSRGDRRPRAEIFLFSVRDPIPRFRIPLRGGDREPEVDLRGIIDQVYDRAGYDLRIDYRDDPVPPLADADRAWAADRLRSTGLV